MIVKFIAILLIRARGWYWNRIYSWYRLNYNIDQNFRFNGAGIQLYGEGQISFGAGSYIGEYSTVQAVAGERVLIGCCCSISHNVRFYTGTSAADADPRQGPPPSISGSIVVGDGVWIGTNCYIAQGITIGDNSVIGANSVVTHSVPENEIWGGVPARFIRKKYCAADSHHE